jgi:hypothetical protein
MSKPLTAADLARWRCEPVLFIHEVLRDPATQRPFELFDAERAFFAHAWQLAEDGSLRYPEQCFGAPKKTGKTAIAAIHLLTTTLLYGDRFSEAYCIANDLEQAQGRVFLAVRRIVEASPLLKREAEITAARIVFPRTRAVIQAIGSDYAGAPLAAIRLSPLLTSCGGTPASAVGGFGTKWFLRRRAKSPVV